MANIYDNQIKINSLEKELEDVKSKLIDLTFELNYNKERELLELVREIYKNVKDELNNKDSNLSKTQILNSLKKYFEQFAKDNKIKL